MSRINQGVFFALALFFSAVQGLAQQLPLCIQNDMEECPPEFPACATVLATYNVTYVPSNVVNGVVMELTPTFTYNNCPAVWETYASENTGMEENCGGPKAVPKPGMMYRAGDEKTKLCGTRRPCKAAPAVTNIAYTGPQHTYYKRIRDGEGNWVDDTNSPPVPVYKALCEGFSTPTALDAEDYIGWIECVVGVNCP